MKKKKHNVKIKKLEKEFIGKLTEIIPPVHKYSSRKEWEKYCWQKITESKDLLDLFVTIEERHMIIIRAAALKGLVFGKSYREISREFFVSLQTIRLVKKAILENRYRGYRARGERKIKTYSNLYVKKKKIPVRSKYGTRYITPI